MKEGEFFFLWTGFWSGWLVHVMFAEIVSLCVK